MSSMERFDGHCHIFTLKYLLKEMRSLLWETLTGQYDWAPLLREPKSAEEEQAQKLDKIKEMFEWFYQTLHAALGSEEKNLDFLQKQAALVYPDAQWVITPLMMDVFFMLAKPMEKGQSLERGVPQAMLQAENPEHHEIAQSLWHEILDHAKKHVEDSHKAHHIQKHPLRRELTELLEEIEGEREFSLHGDTLLHRNSRNDYGFQKTAGFCYHYDKLNDLVKTRTGQLYPFIAIDPRREEIIDSLLSGQYTKEGAFLGVKLYPRMGYHPQAKPMERVYSYCETNNIPITYHCGTGGFPPGDDWKYAQFGDPACFEEVLKAHPKIRINFAHLGNGDRTWGWAEKIVGYMEWHQGVYSDLSCYTRAEYLQYARKLWNQSDKLKSRLLYGTDFDVMYFAGAKTMEEYVKLFQQFFSSEEMDQMMIRNTKSFLWG